MGIKINVALISAFSALVACGGGGSGSSARNVVEEPQTTQVAGGVTKGIVRNGLVDLYAIDENGNVGSQIIASTTSDDNGLFSFDLETVPSITYVEMAGRPEGGTLMQCDLSSCGAALAGSVDMDGDGEITFGEWQAVADDFKLTGYLSGWSSAEPLSINLYTHIVAQTLSSDVSLEALQSANEALQEVLGLDQLPQKVMPIDVTEDVIDSNFADNILMAALLESSTNQELSLAAKVEALASTSSEEQLLEGVSITDATAKAIDLSASLEGDAVEAVTQSLVEQNSESAQSENALPADSRPLLPPFI